MSRFAIVELHKEELKFSAGHFMLFSATQRETLHGHDYQINIAFHTTIEKNGMSFDCRYYKDKVQQLCHSLDYHCILPLHSDYMRLEETSEHWLVHFNHQVMTFLKSDVVVLPITNVTLEELSYWVLQQLTSNLPELKDHLIHGLKVRVFNGRGESGTSCWGTLATSHHSVTHALSDVIA